MQVPLAALALGLLYAGTGALDPGFTGFRSFEFHETAREDVHIDALVHFNASSQVSWGVATNPFFNWTAVINDTEWGCWTQRFSERIGSAEPAFAALSSPAVSSTGTAWANEGSWQGPTIAVDAYEWRNETVIAGEVLIEQSDGFVRERTVGWQPTYQFAPRTTGWFKVWEPIGDTTYCQSHPDRAGRMVMFTALPEDLDARRIEWGSAGLAGTFASRSVERHANVTLTPLAQVAALG